VPDHRPASRCRSGLAVGSVSPSYVRGTPKRHFSASVPRAARSRLREYQGKSRVWQTRRGRAVAMSRVRTVYARRSGPNVSPPSSRRGRGPVAARVQSGPGETTRGATRASDGRQRRPASTGIAAKCTPVSRAGAPPTIATEGGLRSRNLSAQRPPMALGQQVLAGWLVSDVRLIHSLSWSSSSSTTTRRTAEVK
jgi:hypothetical protein